MYFQGAQLYENVFNIHIEQGGIGLLSGMQKCSLHKDFLKVKQAMSKVLCEDVMSRNYVTGRSLDERGSVGLIMSNGE